MAILFFTTLLKPEPHSSCLLSQSHRRLKHDAYWLLVTVVFVCSFYLAVRKEANSHLVDGTGHRPHYSLRTLCRALKYVAANPCNSVQRSLYEVGGLRDIISLKGRLTEIQRKMIFHLPPVITETFVGIGGCWKKIGSFQCFHVWVIWLAVPCDIVSIPITCMYSKLTVSHGCRVSVWASWLSWTEVPTLWSRN